MTTIYRKFSFEMVVVERFDANLSFVFISDVELILKLWSSECKC